MINNSLGQPFLSHLGDIVTECLAFGSSALDVACRLRRRMHYPMDDLPLLLHAHNITSTNKNQQQYTNNISLQALKMLLGEESKCSASDCWTNALLSPLDK